MPDFDTEAYIDAIHRMGKLAATLKHLSFDERVILAHLLDLQVACCPGCGCYVGKPGCHHEDDVVGNEYADCPCPENKEDDDGDTDAGADGE